MPATIIHAVAEIDAVTSPQLREDIREEIAANPGTVVVVDMGAVEFIDSTGLGVLVGALKRARLQGGDLALVNVQPMVMRIFTVTGLHKVFAAPVNG
ncbi:MAG TPA: STAS domain-containing protein [Acidimicrobiales bacterium]|nr:STAS domain-containing protein [Acidimicrobiales bacterium]